MKNNIRKKAYLLLLIASFLQAKPIVAEVIQESSARDNKPPIGCYKAGYQFDLKTLKLEPSAEGDNQALYLLFNRGFQAISLYQMRGEDSSRSLYLNHTIGPRQWAVLSTAEKKLKFICSLLTAKVAQEKIVNCSHKLQVCQYTNVRYGLNNRGAFWLLNSDTRNTAVNSIVRYGIIPGQ